MSTILAPWIGGLEYIGLAIPLTLDWVAAVSVGLPVTNVTQPALSP